MILLSALQPGSSQNDGAPLLRAHAHNDYRHNPPLLQALEHGFASVEADVFLVGEKLCVGHDPNAIRPERTLQSFYLEPLQERARRNEGRVYRDGPRFILLVDIKSAAEPTYRRLHEILTQYQEILTTFGPQGRKEGAVLVIVSGNRSLEPMRSQPVRYAGCDGRLTDLDSEAPADLIPLLSDHWGRHFTWRGEGPMPPQERQKLKDIVRKAHEKGRLVRFWATPDTRSAARDAVWRELLAAGVDLLSTDDLEGLREFLLGASNRMGACPKTYALATAGADLSPLRRQGSSRHTKGKYAHAWAQSPCMPCLDWGPQTRCIAFGNPSCLRRNDGVVAGKPTAVGAMNGWQVMLILAEGLRNGR